MLSRIFSPSLDGLIPMSLSFRAFSMACGKQELLYYYGLLRFTRVLMVPRIVQGSRRVTQGVP